MARWAPGGSGTAQGVTYVDAKEGGHLEVAGVGVEADGEGRRGYVPHGAHDGQGEEADAGHGEDGAEGVLGVEVEGLPGAAPGVDAAEPEDGRVEPGAEVEEEPVLVRVEAALEEPLGEVEGEEAREPEDDRDEAAQGRLVRADVEAAEAPGAAPVADDRRPGDRHREHRVEEGQHGVVEPGRAAARGLAQLQHPLAPVTAHARAWPASRSAQLAAAQPLLQLLRLASAAMLDAPSTDSPERPGYLLSTASRGPEPATAARPPTRPVRGRLSDRARQPGARAGGAQVAAKQVAHSKALVLETEGYF